MKKINTLLCLIAFVSSASAKADAGSVDNHYRLHDLEIREVAPTAEELYTEMLEPSYYQQPVFHSIDWNQVVLIGEKVVEIIKAGKPVVNVRRDAVAVVPQGVQSWDQLSGWKSPSTKVYSVTVKNYLGVTVIDLRLKVSAMYGGGMNGKGKYLANVIVVPSSIYVLWGFNCDVWTENHAPVNAGSSAQPVAGLGFDIRYRYGSALAEQVGAQDYFVTGDGNIKEMQ